MQNQVGAINRLAEITKDWLYFTERDGLHAAVPLIVSDLTTILYRRIKFVVFARSLLGQFPDWQPKIQLLIRPFDHSDLEIVRKIDRPSEARLCANRLEQGHKGLVAFHQGQPAGYAWGSPDIQTRLERVHPQLCPGDILCTDSYTSPAFRGQGVQTALTLARFQLFRELGYLRAVSYIDVRNQPSLAVWKRKFNSQTLGHIDFTRIGPWYRVRYN